MQFMCDATIYIISDFLLIKYTTYIHAGGIVFYINFILNICVNLTKSTILYTIKIKYVYIKMLQRKFLLYEYS